MNDIHIYVYITIQCQAFWSTSWSRTPKEPEDTPEISKKKALLALVVHVVVLPVIQRLRSYVSEHKVCNNIYIYYVYGNP